jgi:hypothetical protein
MAHTSLQNSTFRQSGSPQSLLDKVSAIKQICAHISPETFFLGGPMVRPTVVLSSWTPPFWVYNWLISVRIFSVTLSPIDSWSFVDFTKDAVEADAAAELLADFRTRGMSISFLKTGRDFAEYPRSKCRQQLRQPPSLDPPTPSWELSLGMRLVWWKLSTLQQRHLLFWVSKLVKIVSISFAGRSLILTGGLSSVLPKGSF